MYFIITYMARKLQTLLRSLPRNLEQEDILASFLRIARARWGERSALEPVHFSRGALTVRCPSPLWRTEITFHAEDVKEALLHELPGVTLQRVSGVLI